MIGVEGPFPTACWKAAPTANMYQITPLCQSLCLALSTWRTWHSPCYREICSWLGDGSEKQQKHQSAQVNRNDQHWGPGKQWASCWFLMKCHWGQAGVSPGPVSLLLFSLLAQLITRKECGELPIWLQISLSLLSVLFGFLHVTVA